MKYDRQYFIDKFAAIPDDQWIVGTLQDLETGACCALGHCGVKQTGLYEHTDESKALIKILYKGEDLLEDNDYMWKDYVVSDVNDNDEGLYCGNTPKERILIKLLEENGI